MIKRLREKQIAIAVSPESRFPNIWIRSWNEGGDNAMGLSKYEKETNYFWRNERRFLLQYLYIQSETAEKLKVFAEKYPKDCSRIQTTEEGSETYIIQKGRLSLNLRPPYSEARKQKAAKQIQKVWKEMKGIP